jgi:hypothetical protein
VSDLEVEALSTAMIEKLKFEVYFIWSFASGYFASFASLGPTVFLYNVNF